MCLNIIFVFLCSTLLTYLIFKPIGKIEEHMKLIENGKFITMESDEYENEITNLRQVFNHMILSIKKLMNKVKEEEGIIAKGKLDIIYAQINPHFLYNSINLYIFVQFIGSAPLKTHLKLLISILDISFFFP